MDCNRRIPVHYAVAIAIGDTKADSLHHGPEPAPAARSSAPVAVPVTVATAAKRDLLPLTGLGPVRALFIAGIRPQVDDKPVVTSRLSDAECVVANGRYTLRSGPRVTANEPPASAAAKRSRSS